jgi:hypothetical protein
MTLYSTEEADARRIAALFYPGVRRGRNHIKAEDLPARFNMFTGGNREFAEGLAYALEQGWIIQNDGNYEITEDGCFPY